MLCLIARRCTSRAASTFEYLVAWEGYDVAGDTWEPESHLPKSLVAAYDRKYDISIEFVLAQLREQDSDMETDDGGYQTDDMACRAHAMLTM